MTHNEQKAHELACQIINLTKAEILSENYFLSPAIGRLKLTPFEYANTEHTNNHAGDALQTSPACFAVDGAHLFYHARTLLINYRNTKVLPVHEVLHSVMHCLFLHPFISASINTTLWNLACDIAAEHAVYKCWHERSGKRGLAIQEALQRVKLIVHGTLSAEKIYAKLSEGMLSEYADEWAELFSSDTHAPWYNFDTDTPFAPNNCAQGSNGKGACQFYATPRTREQKTSFQRNALSDEQKGALQKDWRTVASGLAVNLQTFAKRHGNNPSDFICELQKASQKRVNYEQFLRQFATFSELMRLSDDEFDYNYYTYGFSLYKNVALVEPLEFREEKRIREFVLVVDTSGSVQGEVVQKFIETTFNILSASESFHTRVNIHLIWADAKVQRDQVIKHISDIERLDFTNIQGGGGTDFRPAFEYVSSLIDEGCLNNLNGLLYFTDCQGTFPDTMPNYRVAFVFYENDSTDIKVPPWAISVELDSSAMIAGEQRT